jgi:hypothetical protein
MTIDRYEQAVVEECKHLRNLLRDAEIRCDRWEAAYNERADQVAAWPKLMVRLEAAERVCRLVMFRAAFVARLAAGTVPASDPEKSLSDNREATVKAVNAWIPLVEEMQ